MTYLISILSAVIGGIIVVIYESYVSKRQEKALLIVFAKEFINLFRRCSMYYDQMLKGAISASTLCEISDSETVTKLAEITGNTKILGEIIDLKTWFFQVVRQADMASDALALSDKEKARTHQARAMAFFMGDPNDDTGQFDRRRYETYTRNILSIVDYLYKLNEPTSFEIVTHNIIRSERQQALAIRDFCKWARETLNEKNKQLCDLRRHEESIRTSEEIL